MIVEPEPYAAVQASPAVSSDSNLGHERLLSISDVSKMTGLSPVTASKFMKESGRAIALHRRVYILESSLFTYLHELEVSKPCR
ncbi:hypothetical protein [Collinsella aerofaciens]|uniref:hypothetical protein n=1 Tax=Collinsella aerofaciens TaxID=74426 RepID=UPI001898BFD0|nr:hypothetical protein [Collinsella aerofaciens]MDB1864397.1 hypothetical protein [Collinsella aerofaciens]